jgi:hypothetical protein
LLLSEAHSDLNKVIEMRKKNKRDIEASSIYRSSRLKPKILSIDKKKTEEPTANHNKKKHNH